jgi:phosphoenolpyruvate-protein phosphotransferase
MARQKKTELSASISELVALIEKTSDIDQFLADTVTLIADHTDAGLAAIYLHNDVSEELVRASATGDPEGSEFPLRVSTGDGLVGLAFEESRPLRSAHTAENDNFGSQLIVPVRHGPVRIGVFALAHGDDDFFTDDDERFVRAVASHLASSLENTSVLMQLQRARNSDGETTQTELPESIQGRSVAPGIARGVAFLLDRASMQEQSQSEEPEKTEQRMKLFDAAVSRTLAQIEELQTETESRFADIASLIFNSHQLMLRDNTFTGQMRTLVSDGSKPSEAIRQVVDQYATSFEAMEETRFREKAQDVRDLGHRLVMNLTDSESIHADYTGSIVIAQELFPSELVKLAVQHVEGMVFFGSAVTAHIAILASSLGIPVIMSADRRLFSIPVDTPLLLDATKGELFIRPSEERTRSYRQEEDTNGAAASRTAPARSTDSATACNTPVSVLANINLLTDVETAVAEQADGIGLYRSEFPFIIRNDFLAEDEQYLIYRRVFEAMPGQEIVLRTVDIGGDKLLDSAAAGERNPFLGVRGIRFSLAHRDMFRDQLRAMLRAGEGGDLRILCPMVSTLEEVEQGREEISIVLDELERRGIAHNRNPKVGAMIELPSAVEAVSELAEATDFLSIGTNDLVMYLLAVDRTNERLNQLYRTYHPSVLRVLSRIAQGAGEQRSELSVCGDSAGDAVMIPFLLGIGIRKFSVSPSVIPKVRGMVHQYSIERAEEIRTEMLAIRNNRQMEEFLQGRRHEETVTS